MPVKGYRYAQSHIGNPTPIAKAYRLTADGERVEKDAAACKERLSACRDAHIERKDLTIAETARAFDGFTTRQAVVYGVTINGSPKCRLVSKKVARDAGIPETGTADVALRVRACIKYPDGPAIFMADHDPKGEDANVFIPPGSHDLCGKALSDNDLRALLCEVAPELAAAPMILRASGSTWMRRTSDGKQLRGAGGVRCLIGVAEGGAIPAMAAELFDRFVAARLVHIEFSKSGALLVRCPIDTYVYQPERFDFVGGAEVGEGLERNPPESVLHNESAAPFDVRAFLGSKS